jgi:hypothetical protein
MIEIPSGPETKEKVVTAMLVPIAFIVLIRARLTAMKEDCRWSE